MLISPDDVFPCGLEPKDTDSYIPASNVENEPE